MLAFLSGLLAGGLHVLSGPDHLAAVLPLAARAPDHARAFGAFWGLGHGGGMLFWLCLGLFFRSAVPLESISSWAEILVGISLIMVGLWTIRDRARERRRGPHEHRAALGLGMLHGTAGAGHLFVALPLLGLPPEGGAFYCAGFVSAGVISMAGVGAVMGASPDDPA